MMLKMLIIVFILLEILSFAFSGREEVLSHDSYADKLDIVVEPINLQDPLSTLQFQPKILDFHHRSIGDPHNHVVIIYNRHKQQRVHLGSITGSSSDFYSSYFEDKVILPESNTTFKVVFLPRQLGETNSSLIIHTSFGVINYQVRGVGIECQYKLKPLVGIKLPLNATISPEIQLYNPHDYALQISEIYSSGGDFQLELPSLSVPPQSQSAVFSSSPTTSPSSSATPSTSSGGLEGDYKLWEIPPYTSKPIILVRFTGHRAGNHTAYVRIKIAATSDMEEKMLVVPIEIEIYNETGIFSQVPFLDFGTMGTFDGVRRFVYNLLNSGQSAVSIKNWGIEEERYANCVIVDVVQFSRRNFTDHLTIEIDWSKCDVPYAVSGNIFLTSDNDNDDEVIYRIPFYGQVIEGNLSYTTNDLMFLRSDKKSYETSRIIILKNKYNVPLAITNLSVPESCTRYFKLTGFTKPIILQPGSFAKLAEVQPTVAVSLINQTTLEESFRVITNVTFYDIPIKSYSGLLRRIVPVDFMSHDDEKDLNFGSLLPVSKNSELLIAFVNENPIPIDITTFRGEITSGNGQALFKSYKKGCSKYGSDDYLFCASTVKPGEWVVFSVSVQSSVVGSYAGYFQIKTSFEEIKTPVKFSTAMGRLEIKSPRVFENCFPGKTCIMNVQAYSTFLKTMYVESIVVDIDGIAYDPKKFSNELPEIQPNVDTDIGNIYFNPKEVLCPQKSSCYTGFEAASHRHGEKWMRTFSNYTTFHHWDKVKLANQLNSFNEVKKSLRQMQLRLTTSQIRRYEFSASINYTWPRLVEENFEFPFIQVNQPETQFVEIYNPSNQLLVIHFFMHNVSQHGETSYLPKDVIHECADCILGRNNPFTFTSSLGRDMFYEELNPKSYLRIGVDFFTTEPGKYSTLLYIRNNLTVAEAIWLTAKAVVPQFKFGNRKPGHSSPLPFEITEKHTKLCEKKSATGANVLITSKRTFTAKNYGEVPLTISGIRIEDNLCVGYGFKVVNCEPFQLMPNESKKIEITFTPDFTLSRVVRTLNFDTSIGINVNYTLIGTVPASALEMCSKNIERPAWEAGFKRNVLWFFCILLGVVLIAAAMDSDRILKDHARALARDRGPVQPPLDLRKIALEGQQSPVIEQPCVTHQERLNNLNNHQASLNNSIRKRLTMTKKNDVSSESTSRFNLKSLTDLRNKFTTSKSHNEPQQQQSTKVSPKPSRHETKPTKNQASTNSITKQTNIEDDSISSSSKENCEIKSESPPLNKSKNSGKKVKNQENIIVKDPKETLKTPAKPLNIVNQNQTAIKIAQSTPKETKPKSPVTVTPLKMNGDINSHATPIISNNNSSNLADEGQHQNHVSFDNNVTENFAANEKVIDSLPSTITNGFGKNEIFNHQQIQLQQQNQQKKYGKTPGRERKQTQNAPLQQQQQQAPIQLQQQSILQQQMNTNNIKRAQKENKPFSCSKNLTSAFANVSSTTNGHMNPSFGHSRNPAADWPAPPNSIWNPSSSYSDVVAKPPVETTTTKINHGSSNQHNFGITNGMNNGIVNNNSHMQHLYQQQEPPPVMRMNSFNSFMLEQEEGSQFGPIGTRKSPSLPSWEPLERMNNSYCPIVTKPEAFNMNFNYQNNQQSYQPQTSKLMNWLKHNETNTQQQQQQQQQLQLQQQQQQKMYEELYRLQLEKQQQQQKAEWMAKNSTNMNAQTNQAGNLWLPAYRRDSPTSSNWSSPSPPLGSTVPPGFEQYQPQVNINPQPNHQQMSPPTVQPIMQTYDPFKSWSAIWEPSRKDNNEPRESWNQ